MIFKILLSRSVQTPNSDNNWQTSCPLQTFVCNISRHSEFIIEQGHRSTGSPGRWIPGSLGRWVTKCDAVPCLVAGARCVAPPVEWRWSVAPARCRQSRVVALRDGVVVRLDGRHLAVNAHVPQTAAETIARRLHTTSVRTVQCSTSLLPSRYATLPGTMDTKYHLRPRPHNFKLTTKNSSITECDFITRMLFKDVYWHFWHNVLIIAILCIDIPI